MPVFHNTYEDLYMWSEQLLLFGQNTLASAYGLIFMAAAVLFFRMYRGDLFDQNIHVYRHILRRQRAFGTFFENLSKTDSFFGKIHFLYLFVPWFCTGNCAFLDIWYTKRAKLCVLLYNLQFPCVCAIPRAIDYFSKFSFFFGKIIV